MKAPAKFDEGVSQAKKKLSRASRHYHELESVMTSYIESQHCSFKRVIDPTAGLYAFVVESKPLPDQFPLIIGDLFHNLSGSLDYLSSAIVRQCRGKGERVHFPSSKSEADLKRSFKAKSGTSRAGRNRLIAKLCPHFETLMLSKVKPFQGGGNNVWEVRQAYNDDKHNLLTPVASVSALRDVEIHDPRRGNTSIIHYLAVDSGGRFAPHGTSSHTAIIRQFGECTVDVRFPINAPVFSGYAVFSTLQRCITEISNVVHCIEQEIRPRLL